MHEGFDFGAIFTAAGVAKLGQIIIGDLTMAGDNVVIMGSLASGLPPRDRRKVLMFGVTLALVCLVFFAVIATQLLKVTGLVFAGGILLLWVAWRMYREIRHKDQIAASDEGVGGANSGVKPAKTFASAAWGVAVADVSMSLDNVLAVAGAARNHPYVLVFGLVLSVLLMGVAANFIARYIDRYRWIAWVGLLVILWVALKMIFEGARHVAPVIAPIFT
jgi:YjbE family integral membrane protein